MSGNRVLSGLRIFHVPAALADGVVRTKEWTAPSDILLAKIQIWNGLTCGYRSDVPEIVTRQSDGAIVIDGGHDDYTNGGGGERLQTQDWGGNYFFVGAGDKLIFSYGATPDPTGPHSAEWMVTIWTA